MESEEKEPFRAGAHWICSFCFQSYATKFSAQRHVIQKHRSRTDDQRKKQQKRSNVPVDASVCDAPLQIEKEPDSPIPLESPEETVGDVEGEDATEEMESRIASERDGDNASSFVETDRVVQELCDFFCKESLKRCEIESGAVDGKEQSDSDSDTSSDESSVIDGYQKESSDSELSSQYNSSDEEATKPLFDGSRLTYREHLLSVIAYATKHNLNMSQTSDLLELIELHTPQNCRTERSVTNLKVNLTGRVSLIYHDMCDKCFRLFPEDASEFVCATEGCAG